jgi:hypothetical protein
LSNIGNFFEKQTFPPLFRQFTIAAITKRATSSSKEKYMQLMRNLEEKKEPATEGKHMA